MTSLLNKKTYCNANIRWETYRAGKCNAVGIKTEALCGVWMGGYFLPDEFKLKMTPENQQAWQDAVS